VRTEDKEVPPGKEGAEEKKRGGSCPSVGKTYRAPRRIELNITRAFTSPMGSVQEAREPDQPSIKRNLTNRLTDHVDHVFKRSRTFLRTLTQRRPVNMPVWLHVYHVGTDERVQALNGMLRIFNSGAYHAAVEINGEEWSYGFCDTGTGVFSCTPGSCEAHRHKEAIKLGEVKISEYQVKNCVAMLASEWRGPDYDLLRHNCCHFCDAFAHLLGMGPIPEWVTNLAAAGAKIEDALLVGQEASGHEGGGFTLGDFCIGIVAEGKMVRGQSPTSKYVFGDCTRGLLYFCCGFGKSKIANSPGRL
jgi:hypothetical protein